MEVVSTESEIAGMESVRRTPTRTCQTHPLTLRSDVRDVIEDVESGAPRRQAASHRHIVIVAIVFER
jgi:hypothetical protein